MSEDRRTNPRILCLIPARGGSKGLPGKNVRPLCGRPLIGWTIRAALDCGVPMRVAVTTDDPAIAASARAEGAEVVERPADLAMDASPVVDAVLHALGALREKDGFEPDLLLLLQATSPLRGPDAVAGAVRLLREAEGADGVVSVVREGTPPWWLKTVDASGRLQDLLPYDHTRWVRRQDFPPVYRLNGAMYLCRPETLARERDFLFGSVLAYLMDEADSIDIDDEADFLAAEAAMNRRLGKGSGEDAR